MNLGIRDRTNPLIFDKDKNMDFTQLFHIVLVVFAIVLITLMGAGVFAYTSVEATLARDAILILAVATLPYERLIAMLKGKLFSSRTPTIADSAQTLIDDDESGGIGPERLENPKWTLD